MQNTAGMRKNNGAEERKNPLIQLVPTTRENWKEALELNVREAQRHFVPTVAVSLAKVHIRPDGDEYTYLPFCLYNEEQSLVGFAMITVDPSTRTSYWMNGFLIDAAHQGNGYGKEAIQAVMGHIRSSYPLSECLNLTVCRDNAHAIRLYERMGFVPTGDVYDDEIVYRLNFHPLSEV